MERVEHGAVGPGRQHPIVDHELVVGQDPGDGREPARLVLPGDVDPPADVVRSGHVDAWRARGLRVEEASVVRQRGRRRAQHVGAGCRREALERTRLVTHQRGRVGPPALREGAGLTAGERVVRQRRLHELVERRATAAPPTARDPRSAAH